LLIEFASESDDTRSFRFSVQKCGQSFKKRLDPTPGVNLPNKIFETHSMVNITQTIVERAFIETRKINVINHIFLKEARNLGDQLGTFTRGADVGDEDDGVGLVFDELNPLLNFLLTRAQLSTVEYNVGFGKNFKIDVKILADEPVTREIVNFD
jgi:hypothetical protein